MSDDIETYHDEDDETIYISPVAILIGTLSAGAIGYGIYRFGKIRGYRSGLKDVQQEMAEQLADLNAQIEEIRDHDKKSKKS